MRVFKHECFFYIQPSPKDGLNYIIHTQAKTVFNTLFKKNERERERGGRRI